MEQKLKDLLTEQGIKLEPEHPPGKTVSTLIQRGWSLLFGRKGTYLYPAHVERLGGLMVMPFEGLVAPDYVHSVALDSTTVTEDYNFTTAAPRISQVMLAEALTASPYTLAGEARLSVWDGQFGVGAQVAEIPGGALAVWVYTVSQYLGLAFNPLGAVHAHVAWRSWNL